MAILYLDNFDIIINGGVNDKSKLSILMEMIRSIKIL